MRLIFVKFYEYLLIKDLPFNILGKICFLGDNLGVTKYCLLAILDIKDNSAFSPLTLFLITAVRVSHALR
jgi:hypothetical protein